MPATTHRMLSPAPFGKRKVRYEDGWYDVPTYRRDALKQSDTVAGPAVVEEEASVTILCPGQTLAVDRFGNLIISS